MTTSVESVAADLATRGWSSQALFGIELTRDGARLLATVLRVRQTLHPELAMSQTSYPLVFESCAFSDETVAMVAALPVKHIRLVHCVCNHALFVSHLSSFARIVDIITPSFTDVLTGLRINARNLSNVRTILVSLSPTNQATNEHAVIEFSICLRTFSSLARIHFRGRLSPLAAFAVANSVPVTCALGLDFDRFSPDGHALSTFLAARRNGSNVTSLLALAGRPETPDLVLDEDDNDDEANALSLQSLSLYDDASR